MNKLSYTLNPYVISKSFSFYLRSFEVQSYIVLHGKLDFYTL